MVNVPTSLDNLKTKIDELDVGKLKTVPVDLKKLSDVVDKQVVKNTKFNTLNTKVNNLEEEIPDANTLIQINQYTLKTTFMNTKMSEVENKIPNISSLVTTAVLNTKITEVENKIPDVSSLTKKQTMTLK